MRLWGKKTAAGPVEEFTLASVGDDPRVVEAWRGAPVVWRNCSFLDEEDPSELDMPLSELVDLAWVSFDDGWWELGIADEWFPSLDLDADESQDAAVATFVAHPAVVEAYHEDREVFRFRTQGDFDRIDAAALAVAALRAGHQAALRDAGLG